MGNMVYQEEKHKRKTFERFPGNFARAIRDLAPRVGKKEQVRLLRSFSANDGQPYILVEGDDYKLIKCPDNMHIKVRKNDMSETKYNEFVGYDMYDTINRGISRASNYRAQVKLHSKRQNIWFHYI